LPKEVSEAVPALGILIVNQWRIKRQARSRKGDRALLAETENPVLD
jgi:hypothetical protein